MVNYELIEGVGFHEDHWIIRINSGPYKNVTYQYDVVKLLPTENNDYEIRFNTITLSNPDNAQFTNELSHEIFGEVLADLLHKQEHMEQVTKDAKEILNAKSTDIEESDS